MSRFGDACIVRFLAATAKAVRERDEADALNAALEEDIRRLEGSATSCRKVDADYLPLLRGLLAAGAGRAEVLEVNRAYQAALRAPG